MSVKDLRLVRIVGSEQRAIANEIITTHHSYVKSTITVGRRIDYLIENEGKAVGCVGVNTIPLPISKAVLDYFEPITGTRKMKPIFNNVGNNWKFTLTPDAPKNAGSRVLGIFVKFARRDWKATYGDDLNWILTFVGAGHEGTIYKASGWKYLGETAGIAPPKGSGVTRYSRKDGFKNYGKAKVPKKMIFIKDLREPKAREGEAIVVQGEHTPPSSGEMAVTPTQSHHSFTKSYKMIVKNGKARMQLLSIRVDPKANDLVLLKAEKK